MAVASGLDIDPIEGVWISELNYVVPRAYTFTPYWEQAGAPALATALEAAIMEKSADISALMTQAALDAQTALDALLGKLIRILITSNKKGCPENGAAFHFS